MALRSKPEEQAEKLKKAENRYLADPQAGLALLAGLIAPADDKTFSDGQKKARQNLAELKRIIADDFTELCKQDNLPNEAEMHGKLKEAIVELEELVSFPDFANKTIVGIGGGFSAGKSSFINSILKKNLLPNNVTPTTAIPTYLAYGNEEVIHAVNIFDNAAPVDNDAVNALCHDFREKHNVQPKSFIKTLNIKTPDFPYKHLAFVDTPGYSNDNGEEISDRQIALDQLRLAEVLVWVVDIANGTLRQSDIDFIRDARMMDEMESCVPIFVILNKANGKSHDALQQVIEEVKSSLKKARIEFSGIVGYDSISGKELAKAGESISEYLDKVARMMKPCRVQGRIANVFDTYSAHNKAEEVRLKEQLRFFVEFALRVEGKLSSDEKKTLEEFIKNQKIKITPLASLVSQFESIGHKAESLVTAILENLKVKEEKPEDTGIIGDGKIRDSQILVTLQAGEHRDGIVKSVSKVAGISIDCGFGEKDPILLMEDDVLKHLVHLPKVGTPCRVKIVDIHRSKGDVKVVVTF